MPFQSRKQMRWMFANHPAMAHRWAHHTKDIKHLPEHVEHKQAGALHPNLPILRANECVQLRDFLPEMVAKDAAAALGLAPQRLIAPGDTRFLIPLLGVKGPEMQSKTAENGSPVVSLLSMLDLESKSSGKENPELETVTPYLAKASMLFGARNKGQKRLPHALASHAGNKVAGVSSSPITDLQARMVIPHVGHLKTPTAAALHALQARQAEEAAELAKKTKTDAPPPGFHQTDAAQQALGFMSGATGDQPGSGTSVGPGNSPSIHPITSYSGLGAPGTVNGNAAFGTRNNALGGSAKTGSANSPISSAKVQHARKDAFSMEDMSLIALCKRAAIEPLPRWKKEPQIPLDQDMIAQPGVQNLLQSLGMEVQAGQLIAKKIAPCEAGAKEAASVPKMLAGRRKFTMVLPSKIGNPQTPSGMSLRAVGGRTSVNSPVVDNMLKLIHDNRWRGAYSPVYDLGAVRQLPRDTANLVRRHEVMHGLIAKSDPAGLPLLARLAAKAKQGQSFVARSVAPVLDETAAQLAGPRTMLGKANTLMNFFINPTYLGNMRAHGTWLSPVLQASPATAGVLGYVAALTGLMKTDRAQNMLRNIFNKEAGLRELVSHPAAPFVVQPVIGAASGLAMNEVMRHILDAYYGRELPQKTIDRERVQAAGMGAGMGLVRAALPHASDSIMKMLDPGPSGTV